MNYGFGKSGCLETGCFMFAPKIWVNNDRVRKNGFGGSNKIAGNGVIFTLVEKLDRERHLTSFFCGEGEKTKIWGS